ncbi:MAG: DNA primase catalytic subunit PriS [Candidatus Thermoplasmatota archaeon]
MNNSNDYVKSLEFLKNRFREYYEKNKPILPDRFSRREYAFVFYGGKGMLRHLAFNRKQNLIDFLKEKHPAHCYYSTAYYKTPDAATMQEKGWMGAELVFDLDSDHLPNIEDMTYGESLEEIKKEFYKLVDDFLLNDFGFEEKNLELFFSGGRGYHCHVKDPRVYELDSNERKEIVDYITGRGLKDSLIFREQATGKKKYGRKVFPSGKSLKMPPPDEPGWKGRISKGIIEIVKDIKNSDEPLEKLKEYGVTEKTAEKLLNDLSEERVERIKKGRLDQSAAIRRFFLNSALRKTAVSMAAGETDEPVTCDVKRLIRLPGSLHGKTGFRVKELTLDDLEDFNPLNDTVVFSDEAVNVNIKQKFEITLKGKHFELEKGKQKVPKYLAVFLLGRKIALIE